MIKQMNSMPLAVLALMVSSVSLSAHAFSDVRYAPRVTDLATGQATPAQGKTVVLDVPLIAERVNEVVVNVRSSAEGGENLGSGFIIDQRGLIATNFHLISNTEPRRFRTTRP